LHRLVDVARAVSEERVARRLAAIVAADVVGYSCLMGRDENGTLARLKAHRTERFEPTWRTTATATAIFQIAARLGAFGLGIRDVAVRNSHVGSNIVLTAILWVAWCHLVGV
jgi:class 3 adenylate cyclase